MSSANDKSVSGVSPHDVTDAAKKFAALLAGIVHVIGNGKSIIPGSDVLEAVQSSGVSTTVASENAEVKRP